MYRVIFALLTAPLIATLFLGAYDYIESQSLNSISIYLMVTYIVAVIPGSLIIFAMSKLGICAIWHFGVAGLLLAIIGISSILGVAPILNSTINVWGSFMLQFWFVLVSGVLSGLYYGVWVKWKA